MQRNSFEYVRLEQAYNESLLDIADLKNKISNLENYIQQLEDKLYYYKVQESLMRPIIDDNFKG
jgi:hypothetical protein